MGTPSLVSTTGASTTGATTTGASATGGACGLLSSTVNSFQFGNKLSSSLTEYPPLKIISSTVCPPLFPVSFLYASSYTFLGT